MRKVHAQAHAHAHGGCSPARIYLPHHGGGAEAGAPRPPRHCRARHHAACHRSDACPGAPRRHARRRCRRLRSRGSHRSSSVPLPPPPPARRRRPACLRRCLLRRRCGTLRCSRAPFRRCQLLRCLAAGALAAAASLRLPGPPLPPPPPPPPTARPPAAPPPSAAPARCSAAASFPAAAGASRRRRSLRRPRAATAISTASIAASFSESPPLSRIAASFSLAAASAVAAAARPLLRAARRLRHGGRAHGRPRRRGRPLCRVPSRRSRCPPRPSPPRLRRSLRPPPALRCPLGHRRLTPAKAAEAATALPPASACPGHCRLRPCFRHLRPAVSTAPSWPPPQAPPSRPHSAPPPVPPASPPPSPQPPHPATSRPRCHRCHQQRRREHGTTPCWLRRTALLPAGPPLSPLLLLHPCLPVGVLRSAADGVKAWAHCPNP